MVHAVSCAGPCHAMPCAGPCHAMRRSISYHALFAHLCSRVCSCYLVTVRARAEGCDWPRCEHRSEFIGVATASKIRLMGDLHRPCHGQDTRCTARPHWCRHRACGPVTRMVRMKNPKLMLVARSQHGSHPEGLRHDQVVLARNDCSTPTHNKTSPQEKIGFG